MSEQEKNDKGSVICLTPKPSQTFFVYSIQSKENIYWIRAFYEKRGVVDLTKPPKRQLFNDSRYND